MSGDIETSTCDVCWECEVQVFRQYYHYNVDCECCVGNHFEIVRYCANCKPAPPNKITASVICKEE